MSAYGCCGTHNENEHEPDCITHEVRKIKASADYWREVAKQMGDSSDAFKSRAEAAEKELAAVARYAVELRDVLDEMHDLMELVRLGEYKPDSFTGDPTREILNRAIPDAVKKEMNK